MVTQAIWIEEFIVKKGKLTLQKDTKQGSTSNKDKSKYVNKNWEVVHDGVFDNITPKPAKVAFNLIDNLRAYKNIEKPPIDNKMFGNKQKNSSWVIHPKKEYTPLGEPLDVVYKTLLQNKLISPLDNSRPYDP